MCYQKLIIRVGLLLLFWGIISRSFATMTLSGPITASTVTVSGDVTASSVTISSLTVTNQLNAKGTTNGIKGLVLQTKFSSTTVQFDTTNSTLTAIPGVSVTLALENANDYVRISLSGVLRNDLDSTAHLSISRDSTDLGGSRALATAANYPGMVSVGILIVDSPGDTNSHTYQATISNSGRGPASFTLSSTGFFLIEEIGQ